MKSSKETQYENERNLARSSWKRTKKMTNKKKKKGDDEGGGDGG